MSMKMRQRTGEGQDKRLAQYGQNSVFLIELSAVRIEGHCCRLNDVHPSKKGSLVSGFCDSWYFRIPCACENVARGDKRKEVG
mmetsp:Transcript_6194/g.9099  ORF Transcript_6194/g.9099 Transcript_6194/m.9099 type:complete len:83 (+) Transcript_6194:201-449(+)